MLSTGSPLSPESFESTGIPRWLLVRDVLGGSETRVTVEDLSRAQIATRFFDPERLAPITSHAAAPGR